MEIVSKQIPVIAHFKEGGEIEAITIVNGSVRLYALKEMRGKEIEEFYEVDKASEKK